MAALNHAAPLTVFVHVGKCGSTTMRGMLKSMQLSDPTEPILCYHDGRSNFTADSCPGESEVVLGAEYGACERMRARPCRYLTVLREPMERLVSEYSYFCLQCEEDGKFCGRLYDAGCPKLGFLDWAKRHANQFTRHFARSWAVPGQGYFNAYLHGFAGLPELTERDLELAIEALSPPRTELLWSDALDTAGWQQLNASWAGTRAGLRLERELQARARRPLHRNSNGRREFEPSSWQMRQACYINRWDCALYERLRNASCACSG